MNSKILYLGLMMLVIGLFSSCKEYDNPLPVFEEIKDLTVASRKVLVVSIDGLSGEALEAAAPSVISSILPHSKYSYATLSTVSDAGGWVSMLTGTDYAKNQISDDSFERQEDQDSEDHGDVVKFRNVLDYVTQYKPVTTAMVTPWVNLRNYVKNADFAPLVNSDLAVKDSAVSIISKENKLGTIFVNFKDVEAAGISGGYDLTNAQYKDAILKSDEYLGNLLDALKIRKNYAKEEWLVIVTTSQGGSNSAPQKGFVLVYNPAFQKFELKLTGFNSVEFNKDVNAEVPDDHGLYDAGVDQDFTVQMDVKLNLDTRYPIFLSKASAAATTGWYWMQATNGNWLVTAGGAQYGGSGKVELGTGAQLFDSEWHTLTMVVQRTGSTTRMMSAYVDGVQKGSSININGTRNISVPEGLRVGNRDGGNRNLYAANLAYFNRALSSAAIESTYGLTDITKHPNYADLIGFWPMDEGSGGTFGNTVRKEYGMVLMGPYSWKNLEAFYPPGTFPAPVESSISVLSTADDVAALTLYWMKIGILPEFNYDGKPYLKEFEIEFLKD